VAISKTDNDDPNRPVPKSAKDAPRRATLRKESDDPRCRKSSTEIDAAKRAIDLNANEAPK
jgi:hypothetical protein